MKYEELLEAVRFRSGLETRQEAERVVLLVAEALGEQLDEHPAALLSKALPEPVRGRIRHAVHRGGLDVDGLYAGVARREGIPPGFAVEHSQVVCQVLAEAMDADARQHLHKELPAPFARLFEPRRRQGSTHQACYHGPQTEPRRGHTLATGRPGPSEPLSEARTAGAHRDSVARSPDPHADTRLSSSKGTAQERYRRTLATGRDGSTRPLSETED